MNNSTSEPQPGLGLAKELDEADQLLEEIILKTEQLHLLMNAITDKKLSREEAMALWSEVRKHRETMRKGLGRPVHLSTALLDYVTSVRRLVDRPVVVSGSTWQNLSDLAIRDSLTRLYTRRAFSEAIEREIARSERYMLSFSLMLVDVDRFKEVNDRLGHLAGDKVLRSLAGILLKSLRTQDLSGRLGGDELICLLPDTGYLAALSIAERLRAVVEQHDFGPLPVSISFGVSTYPLDGQSQEQLISVADQRLYEAKSASPEVQEERRRAARTILDKSLAFILKGDDEEKTPVEVLDVSSQGVGLRAKRPLPVDSIHQIELILQPPFSPKVTSIKVVYSEAEEDGRFRIGALFPESQ